MHYAVQGYIHVWFQFNGFNYVVCSIIHTLGLLESFKNCYNNGASGEGAEVNPETIEDWKKRLPSIIERYELKDVFNADETGLFFRGLPERSLVVKKGERKGGKKAKERITLLLCCSVTGEKLEPLIIGKSATPRCFRGINVRTLNIRYESNRRAWVTRDIFVAWLKSLNNKFQQKMSRGQQTKSGQWKRYNYLIMYINIYI